MIFSGLSGSFAANLIEAPWGYTWCQFLFPLARWGSGVSASSSGMALGTSPKTKLQALTSHAFCLPVSPVVSTALDCPFSSKSGSKLFFQFLSMLRLVPSRRVLRLDRGVNNFLHLIL